MPDLVRNNRRQFVVGRRNLEQPAIDVNRAARKTEGIDFFRIDDAESVTQRRKGMVLNQTLAYRAEITFEPGISHERQRLFCFSDRLRADLSVLLQGKEIYTAAVCQEQKHSQQSSHHGETLDHKNGGLSPPFVVCR